MNIIEIVDNKRSMEEQDIYEEAIADYEATELQAIKDQYYQ